MTTSFPVSARLAFLRGDFQPFHSWRVALYDSAPDADAKGYTAEDEVTGEGYERGGRPLNGVRHTVDGDQARMTFDPVSWPVSTITTKGALVYNNSIAAQPVLAVLDFGSEQKSVNGLFRIEFPADFIALET